VLACGASRAAPSAPHTDALRSVDCRLCRGKVQDGRLSARPPLPSLSLPALTLTLPPPCPPRPLLLACSACWPAPPAPSSEAHLPLLLSACAAEAVPSGTVPGPEVGLSAACCASASSMGPVAAERWGCAGRRSDTVSTDMTERSHSCVPSSAACSFVCARAATGSRSLRS
jgi:hypothetical protein